MKDIALWKLLQAAPDGVDATGLAGLLDDLARGPVAERVPFLGVLAPALAHAESTVRAAAVRALGGASGYFALKAVVRALADSEPAVRAAAVAALSQSAAPDPSRWAHALFHHLPDVRRSALDHPPGRRAPWYALLATADPECRQAVLDHPPAKVPPEGIFAVLDLVRTGSLPRETAAEFVAEMSVEELYKVLSRVGRRRTPADVTRFLGLAGGRVAVSRVPALVESLANDPSQDALDEVVELFWDPPRPADASLKTSVSEAARFFDRLGEWAVDRGRKEQAGRVACALVRAAARRGGAWDSLAAQVALVLWPDFLKAKWVPADVRRAAVAGLYHYGNRLQPLDAADVRGLLESPVCRTKDGRPDLWVAGGILRWAGGEPYKLAADVLGLGQIANAFTADPEGSAPFFGLPNDNEGRQKLIELIEARGRHTKGSILAGLVLVCPADGMSFLDELDAGGALLVYEALLDFGRKPNVLPNVLLSDNKVRRVTEALAHKLTPVQFLMFLRLSADAPASEFHPLVSRMVGHLARANPEELTAAVRRLDVPRLRRFLLIVSHCAGFPYGAELRLAVDLSKHKDEEVRRWAAERAPNASAAAWAKVPAPTVPVRPLPEAQRQLIASCATAELGGAVEPCLNGCVVGLTEALGRRPPPGMLSLATCVALLGCHDPPEDVAQQFAYFSSEDAEFLTKLDALAVKQWAYNQHLPLFGRVWLHLWDDHCFAAGDVLTKFDGGLVGALRWADRLPSPVLRLQVYGTVARLLGMWRRRDKAKLAALDLAGLCEFLADALGTPVGVPAAKVLVTVYDSRAAEAAMHALQPRVSARLADLPDEERDVLRDWIDTRGLRGAAPGRPVASGPPDPNVLRMIATSRNLDVLEGFCRDAHPGVVQDAALRLAELGEIGVNRLARLLTAATPPPLAVLIAETLSLWPGGAALESVRAYFVGATESTETLFAIGVGLLDHPSSASDDSKRAASVSEWSSESGQTLPDGRGSFAPARRLFNTLLDVCRRPVAANWFRTDHWQRLIGLGVAPEELAMALATSPQPNAYQKAVDLLLTMPRPVTRTVAVVAAFLETDSERLHALRLRAAKWLKDRGDFTGFPLLLGHALTVDTAPGPTRDDTLLAHARPALVRQAVQTTLFAGPHEGRLLELLEHGGVDAEAVEEAYGTLLKDASCNRTRAHVVAKMRPGMNRRHKLARLARTFAWGVVTGREVTGKVFAVEMNGGQGFGHTRFDASKIWVTPLPILRGERHAEDVTRGLIVHEFGHHMYHNGPGAKDVWNAASKEGYHGLLNLVSDEHLERRLRATDRSFGDDLKKLAAFAFQHSDKEVNVDALLGCLQSRASAVLTAGTLGAARKRGCVLVNNGSVLAEMERAGMSFARFVRALRMGLGDRHGDPKVAAGLALFRGKFRHSDMAGLRDVSLKLREIFGWETVLMESFAQDALLSPDEGELIADGDNISADELRDAVRRLLENRKRGRRDDADGVPVRQINRGPEESFNTITTVVPVPFDPLRHAAYSTQVAAPARQMRRYLERLGLRLEPQRMRVQGKRLDKTRLVAGVVRGDPRMLVARRLVRQADLFLGLLIDCSGSMQVSQRLEQGKLFGTLLAESAKGLAGIDVRVFGFTDTVIYDAGDADRCSAHGLQTAGGNNDAAALWHAACLARVSKRKAKLLVMISDGAPTECTTNALKALVVRLTTRMGMCCAQVAVCPIEDPCFPHYVELQVQNLAESVRRFGAVVQKLVSKAIVGR